MTKTRTGDSIKRIKLAAATSAFAFAAASLALLWRTSQ